MASDFIIDEQGNARFDYSIRVSRKARYAKLQIKPYHGLEVVIPTRFPKKAVPELIRQHGQWIEQQLEKHRQRYSKPDLPDELFLAIDNSTIKIDKFKSSDFEENIDQLREWIRQRAWEILPPMLDQVSKNCELSYRKLSIRSQKTRWGSCSSRGTISLNDQLLFVPSATAEYLMIHELCHTRYMNHSLKFWALVESHCPDFQNQETVLNRAREVIPEWFQYSLSR